MWPHPFLLNLKDALLSHLLIWFNWFIFSPSGVIGSNLKWYSGVRLCHSPSLSAENWRCAMERADVCTLFSAWSKPLLHMPQCQSMRAIGPPAPYTHFSPARVYLHPLWGTECVFSNASPTLHSLHIDILQKFLKVTHRGEHGVGSRGDAWEAPSGHAGKTSHPCLRWDDGVWVGFKPTHGVAWK